MQRHIGDFSDLAATRPRGGGPPGPA
jgi:hypothetical protein